MRADFSAFDIVLRIVSAAQEVPGLASLICWLPGGHLLALIGGAFRIGWLFSETHHVQARDLLAHDFLQELGKISLVFKSTLHLVN